LSTCEEEAEIRGVDVFGDTMARPLLRDQPASFAQGKGDRNICRYDYEAQY
jgi:hypothetical protein